MKRITLLTIVAFCGAAVAANIPRSVLYGQTEDERRAEVFSSFIALSDTRTSDAIPFMSHIADLTGQTGRMQQARLRHVTPQVFDALAETMGLEPHTYREALLNGQVGDPFDHSGSVVKSPGFDHQGKSGAWFWGIWSQSENVVGSGALSWCRIWMVIWTDETWVYAPMGTDVLNQTIVDAVPELSAVPFTTLPACQSNA